MDSILPGGEFNAGFLQGIPAFPVSPSLEGRSSELRELRSDCSDSCRLRRAKARTQNIAPFFCLEGVSQMDSILPEPAKDSKSQTLRAGVWLQNNDP